MFTDKSMNVPAERPLRGYTLIELAVVIAVLGIMLAFVVPRLGEIGEANLKRSARHLTGMIRFLRDDAQAKKRIYRLNFDIQNGRYWAEVLTRMSDRTAKFTRLGSALASEGRLYGRTTFRDIRAGSHPDEPYILFTPDGWVEKTYIYLRDGDDRDFTFLVHPLTGGTELREGYLEER